MAFADDLRREVMGLIAQAFVFTVGLCISLVVGVFMAAQTSGPGLLIIVTLITGAGLLGAAVASQLVHDRIAYGRDDAS